MKKSHKTAVIVLASIAVMFVGLLVYCFVQASYKNNEILTQEQITRQNSYMGQMNYFYIGAIVVGVVGGYFLFRSDMRAKKNGQQIMVDSRPSKRR